MISAPPFLWLAMALTAESKLTNLHKSLNVYLHTNLVTSDSLQVHFPGQRGIFTPSGATWVQAHYLLGLAREYMGTVKTSGETGNIVQGIINLNCCELVDQRSGISYAMQTLRDTVRNRFTEGVAIGVQDYDTSGNPGVGFFVITDVTENPVQDGFSPDHGGIAIWNISATGEYVEAY